MTTFTLSLLSPLILLTISNFSLFFYRKGVPSQHIVNNDNNYNIDNIVPFVPYLTFVGLEMWGFVGDLTVFGKKWFLMISIG